MARKAAKKHPEILRYEELEQRLLFSADLLPGVDVDTDVLDRTAVYQDVAETAPTAVTAVENAAQVEEVRHELVFVNENVADYEQLIADLQGDDNRTIEVVVLDSTRDGIEQVTDILAERTNLSAIHFITHGSDGQINLGDSWLNSTTLAANRAEVASWGEALTETGDILFYGCNLAETEVGESLTDTLAELTGADIAASDDLTGNSTLGGDWELEYRAGTIDTTIVVAESSREEWASVLPPTTNVPPVITLPGAEVNYTENDSATVIDAGATAEDTNSTNFSGGTLTVNFTANGTSNDRLAIRNQGTDALQIGVYAPNVTYENKIIGTFSGGTDGSTPLVITFNSAFESTPAAAQALMRNITYENMSENPSTSARTVQFVLTDGDGGTSNAVTKTINVSTLNDAPVNTVPGTQATLPDTDLVFSSDNDNAITVSDLDAGDGQINVTLGVNNGSLSVSNLTGTLSEINTSLEGLTYTPNTSYTGIDTLTITTNDLGNTGGDAQQDIDAIQIEVMLPNTAPNFSSTLDGTPTFVEEGTAVVLDTDVDISDDELDVLNSGLGNYAGASLTLVRNGEVSADDAFAFNDGNGITFSGGNLIKNAQIIASFDTTTTPGELVVSFTEAAGEIPTSADVDNILQQITYANSSDNPPASAQIDWSFDDGNTGDQGSGGTLTATGSTTVTIDATNDAPENTVPGVQETAENTALVFSTDIGNPISTSDPDANDEEVKVTLSVTNGTLTLPSGPSDETLVNSTVTGTQSYSDIALAADGSFVVTWTDYALDGDFAGIFMQRFAADGTAIGSETQVNTYTINNQDSSAVAMDDAGNFVVTWESYGQDGDTEGIYAQRFNSAGVKQGSEFLVSTLYTAGSQSSPDVAMDPTSGDFTITWEDNEVDGIYMKRFASDGTVLIDATAVTTGTAYSAAIATSESGDTVIVWHANVLGTYDVWGQRYDASGSAVGGSFLINTYDDSTQNLANVAMDKLGNFVVVWESYGQDGSYDGIYAQRYDSNGVKQGSEFLVNTQVTIVNQTNPTVAMEPGGDFLIAWECGQLDGSNYGIVAKKYDSDGNVLTEDFLVNSSTDENQLSPAVSSCDKGFVISWHGGGDTEDGVFFRTYFESGLTFSEGDGVDDATMTFTGTIADINSALNGLIYTPNPAYTGSDTLEITTDDQGFTGSGGALNDYDTVAINVVSGSSTPPVVTLPGSAVNYAPNDPAVIIDATATVTDSDSSNFENGTLTVDFTAGATVNDRLAIHSEGTDVGQISIDKTINDGWIVEYGVTTIGTFTGGTYGFTPLVITLNASADVAATQALLRNITYENVSDTPDATARTVRFVLADGDGGTSAAVTETINITTANAAPTFIDGSVGNWNFDEGSGDSITESAIGISTGTLGSTVGTDANDPTWTTGMFGQALHFDGVDDYVEIADAPGIDISGSEFSASLWVKPDRGPGLEDMFFMKGDRAGISNVNYYLSWKSTGDMTWAFKSDGGFEYLDINVTTLPVVDEWNHIAVVFNRPTVSLYINGTEYTFNNVATGGTSMDKDLVANDEPLWIGAGRDGGSIVTPGNNSAPFSGAIDEFAIFDRALTAAEIEAIRTSTPPVVTASVFSIDENSADNTVVGNVVANDLDIGDTLSYAITAGNTDGAFSIDANGQITVLNSVALDFETNPVFNLTVEATDNGSPNLSDTTTVTISLNNLNDAPTGTTLVVAAVEETATAIDISGNVTDVDGSVVLSTTTVTGGPSNGSLINNNNGTFSYTGNVNFVGSDSFNYTVEDNDGQVSADITVTINVSNVNDAPIAVSDRPSLNFDGVDDYIQVADDPSLVMSDTLTMEAWINPSGLGTGSQLILNKEGEYELGIIADTGQIIFAITESDNTWTWHYTGQFVTLGEWSHVAVTYDSAAGEAKTYINGILVDTYSQSGPIGDVYTLENDLTIGGRQNDTDERFDGQIADVRVWNTVRSQVEINANQNATLTGSETGLVGSWLLNDGSSTVAVNSVLDGIDGQLSAGLPTWSDFTVDEDATLTVSVPGILINDFDADGDTLTVNTTPITNVSHGILTLNSDGSFDYTPDADFNGTDSFTYEISDGNGGTDTAVVTINVIAVNDAPVITIDSTVNFTEDSGTAVGATVATFSTSDAEGDAVTVTLSDTTNYSLSGNTVVLTQAGVDLINAGTDLPAFTLTPNDSTIDGIAGHVDPSVITVNDALNLTVTLSPAIAEGTAVLGSEVATSVASDEDGGTITFTLNDNDGVNEYYAINATTGTVTLTTDGAAFVNAGGDLAAFDVTATSAAAAEVSSTTTQTVDPLASTVNDAPVITIDSTVNFTEDNGNVVGDTVATFSTSDEEGDAVTVTLSDTTNYSLSGDTVVLTQAGVDLINAGTDLPAFTLTPNDSTIDGIAGHVDPSVITVNDALNLTVTLSPAIAEGTAVLGSEVATSVASDEDGGTITFTLNDNDGVNEYYAINATTGTVTLTTDGAAFVNAGGDLAAFDVTATSAAAAEVSSTTTQTVDPLASTVNDAPVITIDSTVNFTEDNGNVVGDTVATFSTSDEEGDAVTVTLSDTTNYSLSGNTVVLTQAGVDLINAGTDLPAFTLTPNDSTIDGIAGHVDPSVITVNDALNLTVTLSPAIAEGTAVLGSEVATSVASDEDGGTITFTLNDNDGVNEYYAINATTGTVTLTTDGAAFVNAGGDLAAFDVTATSAAAAEVSSTTTQTVDPLASTVNDAPVITIDSTVNFTEDNGNVVGDTVATFSTSDEEGDAVTVTLSDTTNYSLSGNTVVLTQAGVDLINAGTDLPAFTLTPNDSTIDGIAGHVDPSVITVNDALNLTVTLSPAIAEGTAVLGSEVATSVASDEDGGTITFTLNDNDGVNEYYAINATTGTVTLTTDGAAFVNAGGDLAAFDVTATSAAAAEVSSTTTQSVDPLASTVNDAPVITIDSTVNFTEDNGNVVGDTVATFSTSDEEGDAVTVTLSDTTNYSLSGNTVVLTQAGVDLINAGTDLPAFTLTPNDSTIDGIAGHVDPSVIAVNDAPVLTIDSTVNFTEDNGNVVGDTVATFSTSDEEGNTVTVTLSDTSNYSLSGNTVVLTQAGVDLINAGTDLPAFTLTPNDSTIDGIAGHVDPSVIAVNDAPVLTIDSTVNFTEDNGNVVGDTVATFSTSDEEGDAVTVTLSDTTNYSLSGNTVVLTQAGVDLINAGTDLPAFTLTPNDSTIDGIAGHVDPSVITVNDALNLTVTLSPAIAEGTAVLGSEVATSVASDEDGGTITFTLNDNDGVNEYYAINATTGTVTLTTDGAAFVNAGGDLAAFDVTATSAAAAEVSSTTTQSVDPLASTVNDAPVITIDSTVNFTEDNGNVVGDTVATFSTSDEEGDAVTVTLSDTTNYSLSGNTVVLTQAGVDLINAGTDLPAFTLTPNDSTIDGIAGHVDPSVITVNDALNLTVTLSPAIAEGTAVLGSEVATSVASDEDGGTITFTLNDNDGVNEYYAINATTGTVTLTTDGAAFVNAGGDLAAFDVTATSAAAAEVSSTTTQTVDPLASTVNDAPVITIDSTVNFTEDNGNVVGDTVATFSTSDEEGDAVTVTLSDTTNYSLSGDTVVLTQAGVDLINAGTDLPAFTLTPNDSTIDGIAGHVDPSVIAVNDALNLTVTLSPAIAEGTAVLGSEVATSVASDEDGGTITFTLNDNDGVNEYYAINATTGTVTLTTDGAAFVNAGGDLAAFDVTATSAAAAEVSSTTTQTVDPLASTVNDAPVITIDSTVNFTEDNGNVVGDTVATFSTSDEEGDAVTVTLSDTTNYSLSGNTVVLTQAGVDLINAGTDLPAFTLTPNDSTIDGIAGHVDPSVITVNDALNLTVTLSPAIAEGTAVLGSEVATSVASDEDGGTITFTLNDNDGVNEYYAINATTGTVTLTTDGAAFVNAGGDLAAFDVTATSAAAAEVSSTTTQTVDPLASTVNDAPVITIDSTVNFTEDNGNVVGDTVATFSTSDEEGDAVTVTLSDTTNYSLSGDTVVLTQAGVDLINAGTDLPAFTLTPNDSTIDGIAGHVDPSVITVNDALNLTVTLSPAIAEGTAVLGSEVATSVASDEDGGTITFTLNDNDGVNEYYAINATTGTVTLTTDGAAFVNAGGDLAAFDVTATSAAAAEVSSTTTQTVDPLASTVNDAPVITIDSTVNFTEDNGNVVGDTVATFSTSDEEGDAVTVTLSDTTNYSLSGNTVVLTQAGVDLINAGTDLPAFTLTPNDSTIDGIAGHVDPSVITVNDALNLTVTLSPAIAEGTAVLGSEVATSVASDEDGGTITFTLNDNDGVNEYYAINATTGTVTLTTDGAAFVNAGGDLAAFDVTATSAAAAEVSSTTTQSVDPLASTVNDAPVITIDSTVNFTEDNGNVVGDTVATFSTSDEEGDAVTVTLSDTTNYSLSGNTVVLTQAGVDLINAGTDLPAFTLTPNDSTIDGIAGHVDPSVITVNDALNLTVTLSPAIAEGTAVLGSEVATSVASDEDGGTITFTLNDNDGVNEYYAINATTGTVTLTTDGAAFVNAGGDLAAFDVTATSAAAAEVSSTTTQTVDPLASTVNDAPVITIDSTVNFTEDNGNVVGDTVATFSTSDEEGDAVTVTLSDTTNYSLSGNTVVLTQAGVDLINAGTDLPAFTLTPNDSTIDGIAGHVDPSVITVNDALNLTVTLSPAIAEGTAVLGSEVATSVASDEDGGTITFTLNDNDGVNEYYAINATTGTVTLTTDGAAFVNAGGDLAAFDVTATSAAAAEVSSTTTQTVDPLASTVNDAPVITIDSTVNFTEDNGNVVGDTVATFSTSDEEGDAVTVTLSDTTNYSLSGDTVVLTQAGVDLINAGTDLPAFTLTPNDSTIDGIAGNVDPSVIAVNDAPTITSDGGAPIANVSVVENTILATIVTATDVEGDTLTYSIIGGVDAAFFSIESGTGELSFIAPPDYESPTDQNTDNTYSVNVRVSDGNGGFDNQSLSVTVTDVVDTNNTPIVETTIPDQTLAEDFASYTINLNSSFVDVETADVDLNYSVSGNSNINVSITSGIATISNTANWNGSETLTFTAEDEGSATVSQTVLFTVNPDNDAPTGNVTISGISIEAQTLTAANTLADADGLGAVNYQWQRDGANIDGATAASYLVQGSDVAHNIRVVASYTDGDGSAETVSSAAVEPMAVVVEESIDEIATTIDPLDEEPAPIEEAPAEDQIQDDPTEETLVEDDLLYFEDDGALQEPTEEIEFIALDEDPHAELTEDVRDSVEELRAGDQRVQPEEDRSYSYFDNNLYKEVLSNSYLDFEYQAPENVIRLGEFDDFSSIDFESDNLERIVSQGDYDLLRQEIDQAFSDEVKAESVKTKLVTFTSTAFSVGIVSYLLRAGSFAASFASTLPLWRGFDPIVVFSGKKKQDKDENELPDTEEQTTDLFEGDEK